MAVKCLFILSVLLIGCSAVCPPSCTCDDDTLVVSCIEANIDVIPILLNPSIQRLILRYNKVKTMDSSSFHFYQGLQFVDLSHNQLVSIPTKSFENQKILVELHLNNNKISTVTNKTFEGLRKLTVLNLRGNFLEDLPDKLFSALVDLEELDLGQNRINRIDSTAFQGLTSLRLLFLDDNQLKAVPTPCFPLLGSLAELHVGLNAFTMLPNDAFQGLEKLSVLNLNGAGLLNISDHSFRGLLVLRKLVLTDNRLIQVPTKQLGLLNRLEELSIGQNEFSLLEIHSFKGLNNLRKLDVSGTPLLESIKKGFLSDNLNLDTLTLSSNKKLNNIEDGALAGLPNLRYLTLRDNGFTSFSESLVAWPELSKLDVSENPLHCVCTLHWLRELMIRRNSSQALCFSPQAVKDKSLKTLSLDELGCATSSAEKIAIIGGLCGTAVAMTALLALLSYRYRRRVRDALKDYKWNNNKRSSITRKEHEYQKTYSEEDIGPPPNYIVPQTATLKPIVPVTEL